MSGRFAHTPAAQRSTPFATDATLSTPQRSSVPYQRTSSPFGEQDGDSRPKTPSAAPERHGPPQGRSTPFALHSEIQKPETPTSTHKVNTPWATLDSTGETSPERHTGKGGLRNRQQARVPFGKTADLPESFMEEMKELDDKLTQLQIRRRELETESDHLQQEKKPSMAVRARKEEIEKELAALMPAIASLRGSLRQMQAQV
eukprot:TRINITY_DN6737_c0_g1_i1.p1 TRINITY_DN6737_c0_g1~~TRINITY_DN6737_c0_g1_i1.p1  ORF type:complete len:202 (-),score=28.23 TRINITY_DN6737_c0_g1_i1:91-696(-)